MRASNGQSDKLSCGVDQNACATSRHLRRVLHNWMDESEYSATFALEDEDHTLANALRFFLNKGVSVFNTILFASQLL